MRNSALNQPAVRRLIAPVAALALAGSLATGCGKDEPDAAPTDAGSTPVAGITPSAAPTPSASPIPSAKPSKSPRPTEGNGDGEGDDEPAAAGGGICLNLSEAEIGTVLGGEVTGSAIPGGGCSFNQRNPSPPAATFTDVAFAEMVDGMDGAKENAISAVEGDPQDVPGIGDQAFVVTGTSFGGTDLQGAGAVRIGDRLISVNLAQSAGLPRAKVRSLVLGLLRLAVSRAG